MTTVPKTRRALKREAATQLKDGGPFEYLRDADPDVVALFEKESAELAAAEGAWQDVGRRLARLDPPFLFQQNVPGRRLEDFDLDRRGETMTVTDQDDHEQLRRIVRFCSRANLTTVWMRPTRSGGFAPRARVT